MANKRQVNSRQMAFGGILAAVSLVLMLLSSVIPVMSYGLPAIAGFLTTLVVIECGDRMAAVCYGAVSILSVILVPDKESALLYLILFGWYPIVKRHIEKLRKPVLEWALKLVCMAVPVGAASVVAVAVLGLGAVFGEGMGPALIAGFYLVAVVAFVLYEIVMTQLITAYLSVIRPRYLSKLFK